jgi:hypothetical protein
MQTTQALFLLCIAATTLAYYGTTEPVRPKTILFTGTVLYNFTAAGPTKEVQRKFFVDSDKQILRVDTSSHGVVGTEINDFINQRSYFIMVNGTTVICNKGGVVTENPFTVDMFAKSNFGGVKSRNGLIVHQWYNVTISPKTMDTVETDAFTGAATTISNSALGYVIDLIVLSRDTPDARVFQVPIDIESTCKSSPVRRTDSFW